MISKGGWLHWLLFMGMKVKWAAYKYTSHFLGIFLWVKIWQLCIIFLILLYFVFVFQVKYRINASLFVSLFLHDKKFEEYEYFYSALKFWIGNLWMCFV